MKNLIKALLAFLMFVSFTSKSGEIVQVDCSPYSKDMDGVNKLGGGTSPYNRCGEYNRGEPFNLMDYSSIPYRSQYMDFRKLPKGFEEHKSYGQKNSEWSGLYGLIDEYGMVLGLAKIRAYHKSLGVPLSEYYKPVAYHMKFLTGKEIAQKAKEFPPDADIRELLAKERNTVSKY